MFLVRPGAATSRRTANHRRGGNANFARKPARLPGAPALWDHEAPSHRLWEIGDRNSEGKSPAARRFHRSRIRIEL